MVKLLQLSLKSYPPDKIVPLAAAAPVKPVTTDGIRSMLIYGNAINKEPILSDRDGSKAGGPAHGGF